MSRLAACLTALWATLATPLFAQSPVVVELFTSQGCSSCPPADTLFHELALRDDVIALSLHVDYWDYIGWKDAFADPAHAERQRAYARVAGRRSIYTPQMIVNGSTNIVGAKPMKLADAITKHAQAPDMARLSLSRAADALQISAEAIEGGPFAIHMLRYTPLREVKITRGENAGRTLRYANVVEGWTVLAEWDGRAPLRLETPIEGDKPVVVLVQELDSAQIYAGARVK